MSAFGSTETNEHFTVHDGCKFVFAYYSNNDKCWYVQPRRFFLTPNSRGNHMLGQFIQSNWFNIVYKKSSIALFVVMKVDKKCSINTIEKDMNSLKNPFPSLYDIPPYAKKASYYAMPWQILSNCQKETEKEDGFKFTMRANNNPWDKLTFTIYKEPDNKGIMLTLPEFETIMI
jgi:hypothetical protein